MNPITLLLTSVLLVHPVVDDDTPLRLVALGTGNETVHWFLDDEPVAITTDGEAATVPVPAGSHKVRAETLHAGPWEIHARPDPGATEGATYVQGWSAVERPDPGSDTGFLDAAVGGPDARGVRWLWATALAGLVVALWPARRPKTP